MPKLLLLIILLLSCGLYAQPVHLYDKSYRQKILYIDSIEKAVAENESPAKRIEISETVRRWSDESKDEELAGVLRLAAYRMKNGINSGDTAVKEKELETLLEEYADNKYLRADILQMLGKFYLDIRRRNSQAFEYYLTAYKEYTGFSAKEFPQKRNYIYDLAGAYYRYEDFPNAIRYMNEALSTPSEEPFAMELTMNNTIGLCYRGLKRYDSAMLYFNNAYDHAQQNKDSVWLGILSGNIGETYYLQKDYNNAIARLEQCVNLCIAHNIKRNAVMATCRLAGIYLDIGNISHAERVLKALAPLREGIPFWPEYLVAQRLYAVTARLYSAKGNMAMAYVYADSALRAKDSAYTEQTEINRVRAAEKADYVQRKLDLVHVKQEKQRQYFVRNSLIIIILLVTLIGLLFMNRQRLRQKKLVAELDAATQKLINLRPVVTEPNPVKEEHILLAKEETDIDPETMSKLENATLLTNEQWDEFRKLFDKVHRGFLNNLRRRIPELSQTDIRFIALTKLRLSPKEMASMLGVSPGTIRIYKFRLRKKLGLDKEEDIENFINNL